MSADTLIEEFPSRTVMMYSLRGVMRRQLGLTPAFEDAVDELRAQDDEELFRRCMENEKIHDEGTGYEVVIVGEDQHFQIG